MPTLHHLALLPECRFARLICKEYGIDLHLVEEPVWERREAFLALNPAGEVPVFVDDEGAVVVGAAALMEYLEETRGPAEGETRLMPTRPAERAEVRRLVGWAQRKIAADVSTWIVTEKALKRMMPEKLGGGAPDSAALRAARANWKWHLSYLDHLLDMRNWVAGDRITHADFAIAAELSALDYLGEIAWPEGGPTRDWYARMKSRPSFRPVLADIVRGIKPPAHYADPDF
ncbi:MAG: glutathione S-transferase family protein [Hyphomicrobiaceae bacterium]|nr:glutathione S-transferase family protein [Hyphomicrobiaceae bacterium]